MGTINVNLSVLLANSRLNVFELYWKHLEKALTASSTAMERILVLIRMSCTFKQTLQALPHTSL